MATNKWIYINDGQTSVLVHETSYYNLGYGYLGENRWQFIELSTEKLIGPFYRTRSDLVADISRFARSQGFDYQYAEI